MGTLAVGFLLLQMSAAAAPLTLDDALALAARRNAELLAARSDVEIAAADARGAYAGVLPRLDLTGGFGRQFFGEQEDVRDVPNPAPPPDFVRETVTLPSSDFGAYNLGLALNWNIFDGFASWNAIRSTRTTADAARRQLDESSLRIAFEVTRRFYEMLKQQRALEVRQATAALSAELVERADALFQAGRSTRAETFSARVNLGNDRVAVQSQTAVLARARAELASILGLTTDAGLEIAPPQGLVSHEASPDVRAPAALSALQTEARKNRPVLDALRLSGEAADLEIARARGAWWPVLGLQGTYTKQSTELSGSNGLFGSPSDQYVALAQVTLAWNLFAGGETRAAIARAGAQSDRAQALLEQAEQITAAEVAIAREQVVALANSVPMIREILGAAEQSLKFAREQFEVGRGSQLEVRDATLRLTEARLTWINVVLDLIVARADLNRAVGGTL
jgi:outer membrane protein TolC